jgi:ubiquitin-protein ligase E3 C
MNYDGDVSALGLTFSVDRIVPAVGASSSSSSESKAASSSSSSSSSSGGSKKKRAAPHVIETNLIPRGAQTDVTNANLLRFVYLMADYRLNKSIRTRMRACLDGLYDVIDRDWLRLFASDELNILSAGTPKLELKNVQQHVSSSGGFSATHEVMRWLWDILLNDFDDKLRAAFLQFATSCPRAPLLGFAALSPRFAIQRIGMDDTRLPSSSTCMNLLKLQRYSSRAILKAKLIYAITSKSGFGLS